MQYRRQIDKRFFLCVFISCMTYMQTTGFDNAQRIAIDLDRGPLMAACSEEADPRPHFAFKVSLYKLMQYRLITSEGDMKNVLSRVPKACSRGLAWPQRGGGEQELK
eukprot:GHVU01159577.1.p1 GENE.GHVU01159577.1~~GHVU01159577.1.p1  ORF type:complete len:107 (-),score=6.74 GHVU01159577.1:673-993(-)